jgi:hypothetical protein
MSTGKSARLSWPPSIPRAHVRRWRSKKFFALSDTAIGCTFANCLGARTSFFLPAGRSFSCTDVSGIDTAGVRERHYKLMQSEEIAEADLKLYRTEPD